MSETEYNFQLIEKKAQNYWEENKSFEVEPDPKKRKILLFEYVSLSLRTVSYGTCEKLYDR